MNHFRVGHIAYLMLNFRMGQAVKVLKLSLTYTTEINSQENHNVIS